MDLATWSPLQSDQVREICAHMTPEERGDAFERAALYGIWVAATAVFPIRLLSNPTSRLSVVAGILLIALHLVALPWWHRRSKRVLLSTEWARSQGLSDNFKLSRLWW
jgi:hypothetical protein